MSYLRLDAQEVFPLSAPELDLFSGARMVSSEQQCTRVFSQDITYLKRPLHCQSFYGGKQSLVQGPTDRAKGHRDEAITIIMLRGGASKRKMLDILFCQVVNFIKVELLA